MLIILINFVRWAGKHMIFLGPLYRFLRLHLETRINHFPLIELILYSLDKTIFYLLLIFIGRLIWLKIIKKRKSNLIYELKFFGFAFYLLMLLFLTVFRDVYYPWQLQIRFDRPLQQINLVPLVETFKLTRGLSKLDFIYNLFGNILWFVPFGFGSCLLAKKKRSFLGVTFSGLALSVSIEIMQFFLFTGVSDIDDVLFNTLGTMIGYGLYQYGHHKKQKAEDH